MTIRLPVQILMNLANGFAAVLMKMKTADTLLVRYQ